MFQGVYESVCGGDSAPASSGRVSYTDRLSINISGYYMPEHLAAICDFEFYFSPGNDKLYRLAGAGDASSPILKMTSLYNVYKLL